MKKTYDMKKILTSILFCSITIMAQNDPAAEDLLNKVSENIKAYELSLIHI